MHFLLRLRVDISASLRMQITLKMVKLTVSGRSRRNTSPTSIYQFLPVKYSLKYMGYYNAVKKVNQQMQIT